MGRPVSLQLIHQKTKQRYPLRGDLVIGRSKGDLVFDHDPKLSGKHCLIRATKTGHAIYDLKSRTGVQINGISLPNGKACVLKAGTQVSLGDQIFVVTEDPRETARKLRVLNPYISVLYSSALATLAVIGLIALLFPPRSDANVPMQRVVSTTPFATLDAEFREATQKYDAFERAFSANQVHPEAALSLLKQELIPRFSGLHDELQGFTPKPGQNAKRIDLERRISGAYLGQSVALAGYLETKQDHYTSELAEAHREMQVLGELLRATPE